LFKIRPELEAISDFFDYDHMTPQIKQMIFGGQEEEVESNLKLMAGVGIAVAGISGVLAYLYRRK
jgi:hypothetical protein